MSALVALLLAQATVYAWTDSAGLEHFTDDANAVPAGVKVRTTEGVEVSTIQGAVKPVRPAVQPTVAPQAPTMPAQAELYWRQAFRDARRRITELEEDIEADRTQVEEVNGLPVTTRTGCLQGWWPQGGVVIPGQVLPAPSVSPGTVYGNPCFPNYAFEHQRERLRRNRRELVRAKEELADLDRRASFEAVPQEWRR